MNNDFEARIDNLEIKFSMQDDLLDSLNQVISRQQQQIDQLQLHLVQLAQQVRHLENARPLSAADEIPPHY